MMLKTVLFVRSSVSKGCIRNIAVNSAQVKEEKLKPWTDIPGPSSLPVIGQMHHLLPGGAFYKSKTLPEDFYNMFGPICKLDAVLGKPTFIFLFDPECCAQILRGENWMPVRPSFQSLQYYRKYHNKTKEQSLKPTGLITEHGDSWKQFRMTVNPVMLQTKTIRLYGNVLNEVAEDMVKRLRSIRNEDNSIKTDFDVEMNLWALESIGVVALGNRLNCFDPNLPEDSPARQMIRCVHELFKILESLDFQPGLWRYFATPAFKNAMAMYEEHEQLTMHFIRKAMDELQTKTRSDDEKGIMEKLLEINEEVANIMACDMLLAGVDTAAHTMIGILYLLAKNPDKQNKLREEILSKEEARKYLKACIKESMRIFPVTSGNIRVTTKDYNILGYHIPKDMTVVLNHQFMATRDNQFPKPFEFIPERWIEKDSPIYYGKAHPFAYNPFGFGVRSCIGRRIAELELETFLAKAVENFQIDWIGPPPEVKQIALNYMKGPFNFRFKDI